MMILTKILETFSDKKNISLFEDVEDYHQSINAKGAFNANYMVFECNSDRYKFFFVRWAS